MKRVERQPSKLTIKKALEAALTDELLAVAIAYECSPPQAAMILAYECASPHRN